MISNNAPSVTIIAPAYNESATIVQNIKSLLSLHYPNFQIIVVNDGSKDDTLDKVVAEYNLEQIPYSFDQQIETEEVIGVYQSTNASYARLLVVDKVNGGKADALNVGVNLSVNQLVTCIDVDCMLEEDSLLKLVKPFLESSKKPTIATGGIIKVANSCEVKKGKLIAPRIPSNFLARMQILEYIRAFLMGRMAWSRLNGLLLISGAFGMFDRALVVKSGGYDRGTVGEDMELIVRMRRYMEEHGFPYRVAFIPDPLCWTEVPEDLKILASQRNRWTRGTIETLWLHRKMFFNPKYGMIGMLSYPYWFFFEWMAPLVEFFGLCYFIYLYHFGGIYWEVFFGLLAAVYLFAVMFSALSLLVEELSYNEYPKLKDMLRLMVSSWLEPFTFHGFVIYAALRGNWDKLTRKKVKWGTMSRKGFDTKNEG